MPGEENLLLIVVICQSLGRNNPSSGRMLVDDLYIHTVSLTFRAGAANDTRSRRSQFFRGGAERGGGIPAVC